MGKRLKKGNERGREVRKRKGRRMEKREGKGRCKNGARGEGGERRIVWPTHAPTSPRHDIKTCSNLELNIKIVWKRLTPLLSPGITLPRRRRCRNVHFLFVDILEQDS